METNKKSLFNSRINYFSLPVEELDTSTAFAIRIFNSTVRKDILRTLMSFHIELKSELSIYFNGTCEKTTVFNSEGRGVKKSSDSYVYQDQNNP